MDTMTASSPVTLKPYSVNRSSLPLSSITLQTERCTFQPPVSSQRALFEYFVVILKSGIYFCSAFLLCLTNTNPLGEVKPRPVSLLILTWK